MYVERMQLAIETLEQVRDNNKPFDMDNWFEDYDNMFDCGTSACALGWIARQQWAKDLGLFADYGNISYYVYEGNLRDMAIPFNGTAWNYSAAMLFFGLSPGQAVWLFAPGTYTECGVIKPDAVIERMRYLLDHQTHAPRHMGGWWPQGDSTFVREVQDIDA